MAEPEKKEELTVEERYGDLTLWKFRDLLKEIDSLSQQLKDSREREAELILVIGACHDEFVEHWNHGSRCNGCKYCIEESKEAIEKSRKAKQI